MQITVSYGPANVLTRQFPPGTTYRQIIGDTAVQSGLGVGTNVRPLVHGVEQNLDAAVLEGVTVVLEQKASTKGI